MTGDLLAVPLVLAAGVADDVVDVGGGIEDLDRLAPLLGAAVAVADTQHAGRRPQTRPVLVPHAHVHDDRAWQLRAEARAPSKGPPQRPKGPSLRGAPTTSTRSLRSFASREMS